MPINHDRKRKQSSYNKEAHSKEMYDSVKRIIDVSLPLWLNLSKIAAQVFDLYEYSDWQLSYTAFYIQRKENKKKYIIGPFQGPCGKESQEWGVGLHGIAIRTKKTQLFETAKDYDIFQESVPKTESCLLVPVVIKGEVVALWELASKDLCNFDCMDALGFDKIARELLAPLWEATCDLDLYL
ncbi:hypothetical protein HDV01_000526 [Terramyces sp. JEL0728]|nr:hypothetical protein HDV01_000526 [Terramyces sp. JEL0728]